MIILIKEEETNPNRMIIYCKTIAKAFDLHNWIREHEIIVIKVVI